MDAYAAIAGAFHQRIDLIASAVDELAPGLEAAGEQAVATVLGDGKLLVCAAGEDHALGAYAASRMREPLRGGPSLPAVYLGSSEFSGEGARLWRDLRTLSRDGDVLLCIDTSETGATAAMSQRVARERNLAPITLSYAQLAAPYIPLSAASAGLRGELALMAINSLLDLIRLTMLGE